MKDDLLKQCEPAISKAIFDALTHYESPLKKAVHLALESEQELINKMVKGAVNSLVVSDEFQEVINKEVQAKLARVLISKAGGEIEKAVNKLKQDDVARAHITLTLDEMFNHLRGN